MVTDPVFAELVLLGMAAVGNYFLIYRYKNMRFIGSFFYVLLSLISFKIGGANELVPGILLTLSIILLIINLLYLPIWRK